MANGGNDGRWQRGRLHHDARVGGEAERADERERLVGDLAVYVERRQADVAEGRLRRGAVDLGDEAPAFGLVEQVEALTERLDLDGEQVALLAQVDQPVRREARLLRELPLGIRDAEVGRVADGARSGEACPARDERPEVERNPETDRCLARRVAAADGDVGARGELRRWQEALGEELRRDDAPPRPARAQAGVGEDRHDRRLVRRQPVREVERDRRERGVPQPRGPHGERVGRWDGERRADGVVRERPGHVPHAPRAAREGGGERADTGEAAQHGDRTGDQLAPIGATSDPSSLKTRSRGVPPSVISAS